MRQGQEKLPPSWESGLNPAPPEGTRPLIGPSGLPVEPAEVERNMADQITSRLEGYSFEMASQRGLQLARKAHEILGTEAISKIVGFLCYIPGRGLYESVVETCRQAGLTEAQIKRVLIAWLDYTDAIDHHACVAEIWKIDMTAEQFKRFCTEEGFLGDWMTMPEAARRIFGELQTDNPNTRSATKRLESRLRSPRNLTGTIEKWQKRGKGKGLEIRVPMIYYKEKTEDELTLLRRAKFRVCHKMQLEKF